MLACVFIHKIISLNGNDTFVTEYTLVNALSFNKCIKLRNPKWAECDVPDVGFSQEVPKSKACEGAQFRFLGDSVMHQIYDAFVCLYPECKSEYILSGVTGRTLCDSLKNSSFVYDKYDFLVLSEGLWFNRYPIKHKMHWEDFVQDVACALERLKEMQIKFLWIQRTSQHFNTRDGLPRIFRAKAKRDLKSYAKCVPVSSMRGQRAYHRVLDENFKALFPRDSVYQVLVEDFTAKMHMMHSSYIKNDIKDCTHFCQKSHGVPLQFAKKIAEQILKI